MAAKKPTRFIAKLGKNGNRLQIIIPVANRAEYEHLVHKRIYVTIEEVPV